MAYTGSTKNTRTYAIQALGFYGTEPEQGSDLTKDIEYGKALNWYNTFHDPEVCVEWLEQYLKAKKYPPKDIAAIKRAGTLTQSQLHAVRMLNNECIIPDRVLQKLNASLTDALKLGRMKTEVMFGDRLGPAERNKRKALEFRGELDYLYDQVWEGKVKPADLDLFDAFTKMGMKPKQAQVLLPEYKAILVEEQDKDPEVNKSKKNPRARLAFVKDLVESLEAWSKNKDEKPTAKIKKKVTERKIGKRVFKSTRPIATCNSLKFKALDEDTKLTSIAPKQILGAQMLIIFNAKYKQLAILRAANAEGLSVKGTTILNVDEKTSEAKRAGRHMTAIKEMVTAPKTKIAKLFKAIAADPIPVRTRTSEDIVLVRAIK